MKILIFRAVLIVLALISVVESAFNKATPYATKTIVSDHDGDLSWDNETRERNWDSMTVHEFRTMLTSLIDRRIKYHQNATTSLFERIQRRYQLVYDEFVQMFLTVEYSKRHSAHLMERVRRLEMTKSTDSINDTSSVPTSNASTFVRTITTRPTTKERYLPHPTAKKNHATTPLIHIDNTTKETALTYNGQNMDDENELITPALQSGPVEIDLSNRSRRFLRDLLANFTRKMMMVVVGPPDSLNITMGVDTHVILPLGNHTILLQEWHDYELYDFYDSTYRDEELTLEAARGVSHLKLGCQVFDLENDAACRYEYLQIDEDVKYCGNQPPQNVVKQHSIKLFFHSDPSVNGVMRCHVEASV